MDRLIYISDKSQLDMAADEVRALEVGEFGVHLRIVTGQRTTKQNASLHKYFQLLSDSLNDAGLDMRRTLKEEIDIPWTPANVKEHL